MTLTVYPNAFIIVKINIDIMNNKANKDFISEINKKIIEDKIPIKNNTIEIFYFDYKDLLDKTECVDFISESDLIKQKEELYESMIKSYYSEIAHNCVIYNKKAGSYEFYQNFVDAVYKVLDLIDFLNSEIVIYEINERNTCKFYFNGDLNNNIRIIELTKDEYKLYSDNEDSEEVLSYLYSIAY